MSSDVTKQFAVNWNNHMNHVKKAFDNLLNNCELTDVTLYAEGKKVGAHKMLLSACSAYFRNLFREFPQEHPIVVLKGVSYSVLADILKFIYNGEVSVDSDVFDSFLQTAEFLQISGLTDGGKNSKKANGNREIVKEEGGVEEEETEHIENKSLKKEKRGNADAEENIQCKRSKDDSHMDFSAIKCEPNGLTIFPDELSDTLQENSQLTSELLLQAAASNNYAVDEAAFKSSILQSVPSILYDCEICGKSYKLKDSLSKHLSVHAGYTTCIICSKVLSRKTHLDRHMMQTHGVSNAGKNSTVFDSLDHRRQSIVKRVEKFDSLDRKSIY